MELILKIQTMQVISININCIIKLLFLKHYCVCVAVVIRNSCFRSTRVVLSALTCACKYKSSTTAYYMINDYKAPSSTSSFINTSTQVHVQYTATPTHTSHLLGINAITKYLLSVSLMSINNVSIEEKEGDII